ncbi:RloB domain-containing protein [Enterococcus faecalis]|uniref:RloB domain-containing protein n=2 Tax=Enterococcus TaxID=1350 RepID=UPI00358F98FC
MIFCEGETEEAYLRLIKRKYSAVNIKSKLKVKTCRRQGEALVEYAVSCIRSMGKAERDNLCMTRTNKPQNRLKTR